MKKNLRNVLALALGLMTTVSFAQDWNVDSRTRMDVSETNLNGNSEDFRLTNQRVTLGATWGGSDWGIHVSSDFNYNLGDRDLLLGEASMSVYEAYASANMFGMASMTVGRQALEFGSGNLVGKNDWGTDRNTWDGASFGFDLDMADVTLGYATRNDDKTQAAQTLLGLDDPTDDATNMYLNMNGEFSGWNVNVLYLSNSIADDAAYGIDLSGGIMGASVSASLNEDYAGNSMRMFGLGYSVNDNLSLNVGQTAYGDENADVGGQFGGFAGNSGLGADLGEDANGDRIIGNSWATHGNIGFLGAGMENLHYGLSYSMGGITLSATAMRISDTYTKDDVAESTAGAGDGYKADDYDRQAMEIGLSYSLGNNANLGLKYVTDELKNDGSGNAYEQQKFTWLTLTVTP